MVFTKVNVVSMGFYILPTNIAIYKYVCMYQYRGTNYKIHFFFFFFKKRIMELCLFPKMEQKIAKDSNYIYT